MSWEDILKRGRRPVKKPEKRAEERFQMSKPTIVSREERRQQMKESKEQLRRDKLARLEEIENKYPALKEVWRHNEAWNYGYSGTTWNEDKFKNASNYVYGEFMKGAKAMKLLKYNLKSVPKDILYERSSTFRNIVESLDTYLKDFEKHVNFYEGMKEKGELNDQYNIEQLEEKRDGLEAMKGYKEFYRKYLGL